MTIKLGLIGAGSVAQLHAESFQNAGVDIVAVSDVDQARAQELAARSGGGRAYGQIDDLLSQSDVQAVVVALPNVYHKPVALAALAAGKDVLLEKPMALDAGECDEIVQAVQGTDRILQMGFVTRGSPAAVMARSLIDQGKLGSIHHVKASLYRARGIPGLGRWFTRRDQSGGGVLIDIGVHMVDLVMHLLGDRSPQRVSAVCNAVLGSPPGKYSFTEMWGGPANPDGIFDVEDTATALVRFAGGRSLELNTTWACHLPEGVLPDGVILFGDRGGLFVDVWGRRLTLACEEQGRVVQQRIDLGYDNPWGEAWDRQARNFTNNVANRAQPEASAEDGRSVQRVLEAMYRSSEQGCEVEI